MNKKESYTEGFDYGYEFGLYCEVKPGEDSVDACLDAAENAKQYTPFEFLAHEINEQEPEWRVDGLWEAFDSGVHKGILAGLKARDMMLQKVDD